MEEKKAAGDNTSPRDEKAKGAKRKFIQQKGSADELNFGLVYVAKEEFMPTLFIIE